MPDIIFLLPIKGAPDRVYESLTEPAGIKSWWTRDASLDGDVEGVGEFGFFNGSRTTKVRIAELQRPERVAWETVESNVPGWTGTRITFEVRPDGEGTVLFFAHRGFATEEDCGRYTTGWGYYLRSLQQYHETGVGTPH